MAKRRSELERLIEMMLRRHGPAAGRVLERLMEAELRTHPDPLIQAMIRGKPPKPRKRRPDEGGEPALVEPRPKPKPLSGGAAAPIPPGSRRKTVSKAVGEKTARTRVPTDGGSSLNL